VAAPSGAHTTASIARLLTAIDVGDHLHLNPAGCHLLADTVPARLFQLQPMPGDFGLE
jgi:hypothetical protein